MGGAVAVPVAVATVAEVRVVEMGLVAASGPDLVDTVEAREAAGRVAVKAAERAAAGRVVARVVVTRVGAAREVVATRAAAQEVTQEVAKEVVAMAAEAAGPSLADRAVARVAAATVVGKVEAQAAEMTVAVTVVVREGEYCHAHLGRHCLRPSPTPEREPKERNLPPPSTRRTRWNLACAADSTARSRLVNCNHRTLSF